MPNLILNTKVDLQKTAIQGVNNYHLGAYITKASFGEFAIENPTSEQMAMMTKIAAENWIKITHNDESILNSVEFCASLPPHLLPNIAICYNNKFRVDNHPRGEVVDKKYNNALSLVGKEITFEFTADNLQFLVPTENAGNEQIENLSIVNNQNSTEYKVKVVPLTSYNKGSNLISFELNAQQQEELLKLAAQVTGDRANAQPTNASNQPVPFSFTLAKMSNLGDLVFNLVSENQCSLNA